MSTRSKILMFLPAGLIVVIALAMAWVLRTESGAAFAWQRIAALVDGQLSAEQISGDLSSTLVLRGFDYRDDSVIVSSPEISLDLDFDLFPPAINVTRLDSKPLRIQLLDSQTEAEESSLADTIANLLLPVPVRFPAVAVERLEVLDSDLAEVFVADDLQLQGRWFKELEIRSATLHSLNTNWALAGEVQLQAPFAAQGKITAHSMLNLDEAHVLPVEWQAEFDGDLSKLTSRLYSTQSGIAVSGELRDLLDQPGWDLQLTATELEWPPLAVQAASITNPVDTTDAEIVDTAEPVVRLRDIQLRSQGTLEAYELQLTGELDTWLDGEPIALGTAELTGQGNTNGIHFEPLRISGDELKLSATAEMDWQEEFKLTAHTQIESLHPARWIADWPKEHPLSGDLNLTLSPEHIGFSDARLVINGLSTQLQGQGSYRLADELLSAELSWQSLDWPIAAVPPEFSSQSGQLNVAGSLDDWNAEGSLQLRVSDYPEGRVQLHVSGSTDAVKLTIDQGQLLGGQFAGTAEYQWAEPGRWSANITANKLNTGPLLPDFPAVVSGTIKAEGESTTSNLRFELSKVHGQLHGREFTGQGKFALQDAQISAQGLQLRSGSSRLDLDGGMGPGQKLRFTAIVDEFSELWPDASGSLQAHGVIALDARAPVLDIAINADELHWGENHIASIRTREGADGMKIIAMPEATLGGRELQNVQLSVDSKPALASLQLQGQIDKTLFETQLRGQLTAAQAGSISGWNGLIESLQLNQPDHGFLNLQQPVALSLSTDAIHLDETCLLGNRDGRICLRGQWNRQQASELSAEVENVSLDIVRLFADMDWSFTHRLNGHFDWRRQGQQPASAQAEFDLSAGELIFDQENSQFNTGPGVFAFQISEGNLHSGNLHIPIPGSGDINMDFNVTELDSGGDAQLQAVLKVDLLNLIPVQLLVPYVDVIKGELSADVRVAGTVDKPQFTGHATLVRGLIEEQSSGLVLSDIQLAGAVYQNDRLELNGSFRAGNGHGQIKADLQFQDFLQPELSLQLKGEELLLVDVPDLNLLANPDLDIRWKPSQLQLNGRIVVPKAQLSPRYLPASSATESPDLIIVSELPEVEKEPALPAVPMKITGQVEVELGKEVNLTLDKATANITGKTNFIWNNDLLPTGDGYFRVSGEIYAYGQLLNISEGRVSFPRGPADNPNLNIKAEREIFGNTQVKRAGVRVSGTLKRPTLEPYTDPMTTRERALAMILTGSDFDYEQGVGAVEVGMYIAPKLFVSYGIGLFEDQNVISARYDLGKGFGVKATSGQRETGVDISYTIER